SSPVSGIEGLAVDGDGNVYVADQGNNTIRRMTPDGVVTTLAGRAREAGASDGDRDTARFFAPISLAVDASGNVFVAHRANDYFRISADVRKISPRGDVTTLIKYDKFGEVPLSIALDAAGTLYILTSELYGLAKITTYPHRWTSDSYSETYSGSIAADPSG